MTEQLPTDLAYAAGFLDGEGCFTLVKKSGHVDPATRGPLISASQIGRERFDELAALLGGNVREMRKSARGLTIYQWNISSAEGVKAAIPPLLPYLRSKKREAEIVLAYAMMIKRRGRRIGGVSSYSKGEEIRRLTLIAEMQGIRERAA